MINTVLQETELRFSHRNNFDINILCYHVTVILEFRINEVLEGLMHKSNLVVKVSRDSNASASDS